VNSKKKLWAGRSPGRGGWIGAILPVIMICAGPACQTGLVKALTEATTNSFKCHPNRFFCELNQTGFP